MARRWHTDIVMSIRHALVVLAVSVLSATPLRAQPAVATLNDTGWAKLQRGDGDGAARVFREALDLRPDDPVLLFGAGVSAHLGGHPAEAVRHLRRALSINPRLTSASRLLGEIAYSEGDTDLAIATYEAALRFASDDVEIANQLAAWRTEAQVHRSFEERRYDRFRVMFEGRADEQVAARATDVLNSAFWEIGRTIGAYPSNAIVVILYTERQFRDITRAPEWSGGVYDGRIRIPTTGASDAPELFNRVLVHELAHSVISSITPQGVPAWLHEGIAQHFERKDVEAARRRLKSAGRTIPLAKLERSFAPLSAVDAQIAYDESLLAADVIFQRPGFGWMQLLNALADSDNADRTLGTFGLSYADLETELAH